MTLIELLVALGIISLLAAVIYPAYAAARRRAYEAACTSNLRQIGQALSMYIEDYDRPAGWLYMLSPGYVSDRRLFLCPADPFESDGGWQTRIYWSSVAHDAPWTIRVPAYPVSYCDFGFNFSVDRSRSCAYTACILHGEPMPRSNALYSGKTLRLFYDGSVRAVKVSQPAPRFYTRRVLCDEPDPG